MRQFKGTISFKRKKLKKFYFILIIIIVLEVIILIANIIYMKKKKYYFKFRDIDKFLINSISHKYNEISEYLFLKFKSKNSTSINEELYNRTSNLTTKTVKVCKKNMHIRWVELMRKDLKGKINLVIDEENPDYLLYATFGCENVLNKYNNIIIILLK